MHPWPRRGFQRVVVAVTHMNDLLEIVGLDCDWNGKYWATINENTNKSFVCAIFAGKLDVLHSFVFKRQFHCGAGMIAELSAILSWHSALQSSQDTTAVTPHWSRICCSLCCLAASSRFTARSNIFR